VKCLDHGARGFLFGMCRRASREPESDTYCYEASEQHPVVLHKYSVVVKRGVGKSVVNWRRRVVPDGSHISPNPAINATYGRLWQNGRD